MRWPASAICTARELPNRNPSRSLFNGRCNGCDHVRCLFEGFVAIRDSMSVRNPGEIGIGNPDVTRSHPDRREVAPASRAPHRGFEVRNNVPRGGLPNTRSVDGRNVTPASAASLDWSISSKNIMPLSATSIFRRLMVSGMEYALLMRTIPSSAALAVPDSDSVIAHANITMDQMHRLNMDCTSWLITVKHEAEYGEVRSSAGPSGSRLSWSYMLWSLGSFSRSAESSTTFLSPIFFHQCETSFVSATTSPALCTIGTAQLLAYSSISPSMM